jgi:hypothetical protein
LKKFILIISILNAIGSGLLHAQYDPIKFIYGKYTLETTIDSVNYCSNLIVYRGSLLIYNTSCKDWITDIKAYDLSGEGNKELFIEYYSGGAHCCFTLNICKIQNDNFIYLDTLFLGNAGYELKDLDNDGELELITANDMFAYEFTNYAQSRFSIKIFQFKNNKLELANKEFEKEVLAHINELKDELKEYTKNGFECPANEDEETFNTDAGAVQAILAPIVADYESIGMTEKGYELINKIYTCPDKNKFIKILKQDFKLK